LRQQKTAPSKTGAVFFRLRKVRMNFQSTSE
jgi:hypothetical protein